MTENGQLGMRRVPSSNPSLLAVRKGSKRMPDMLPTSETDVKIFKPMVSYQKQKPGRVPNMFSKLKNTNTSAAEKPNDANTLADELNEGGELVDVDRISGINVPRS